MASYVILALDVSTDRTGVAFGPARERPSSIVWRFDKDDPVDVRHAKLARAIGDIVSRERPSFAVIEEPLNPAAARVITNMKTTLALIGGACVAAATLHLCGVRHVRMVSVQAIRKAFIGRARIKGGYDAERRRKVSGGEAAKAAVMAHCRLLGWPAEDHNAADALAAWSWMAGELSPMASLGSTPLFGRPRASASHDPCAPGAASEIRGGQVLPL